MSNHIEDKRGMVANPPSPAPAGSAWYQSDFAEYLGAGFVLFAILAGFALVIYACH